jgi:hypothetical protein
LLEIHILLLLELVVQEVLELVFAVQMADKLLSMVLSSLQVVAEAAVLIQDKLQTQVALVAAQATQMHQVVHHLSLAQKAMYQQPHLLKEMLAVQVQLNLLLAVVVAQELLL